MAAVTVGREMALKRRDVEHIIMKRGRHRSRNGATTGMTLDPSGLRQPHSLEVPRTTLGATLELANDPLKEAPSLDTRTIAIIALIIAVIVVLILVLDHGSAVVLDGQFRELRP